MNTSHPKFKQMMVLFTQTKQIGYRHTIAYNISEGRTESTKDLTEEEVDTVIDLLKKQLPEGVKFTPKAGDAQRKKIIAIAREMRWDVRGTKVLMQRIDDFMLTRTKYKKRLNDLAPDELNKVLYTFENDVKSSFLSGLNQ